MFEIPALVWLAVQLAVGFGALAVVVILAVLDGSATAQLRDALLTASPAATLPDSAPVPVCPADSNRAAAESLAA